MNVFSIDLLLFLNSIADKQLNIRSLSFLDTRVCEYAFYKYHFFFYLFLRIIEIFTNIYKHIKQ